MRLADRWPLPMPIGVSLKQSGCLNHCAIVQRSTDKLYAEGQFVFVEATGHADRGQPA
jgi:hypothetical protein